jgi:hypothetical protein
MIWMADNHNKLTSMGNFARDHIQKYTMKNATQGLLAAIDALKI